MHINDYIHILDDRIRVRIPGVKRSPQHAAQVERDLVQVPGITEVAANPLTGCVLIQFDSQVIDKYQVLSHLEHSGHFRATRIPLRQPDQIDRDNWMAQLVAKSVVEAGLNALVRALV
jgi:copper chaperone CopZ